MQTLTEEQSEVSRGLKDFYLGINPGFHILSGSAGTGKTTVISHFCNSLTHESKKRTVIAAPTHQALSILSEKLESNGVRGINLKTVASLLNMRYNVDEVNGKEVFTFTDNTNTYGFKNYDLIIIDESSMIPKNQVDKIVELAIRDNVKVIFTGDVKQLPPVNEDNSLVFSMTNG